ncbi:MAG: bifunctional UDP-N-acetylmuramoyl-L-alanyl-D-glutamate--2,6-diaminopimelate ligase MurE/UDP-N-acetylmuramoyl-tripeptide--D-alanyl-D-alanine ligase MurF [Rhodoferax sp.]|uniref:bifunctional UDP-N-acetylmuramoyl-L-alanyl-D-glutamate--2, 6-diaminopimelate ligase MurE/UDP-N-acetylmuramoyl-tripeptide--D-alanyl-D-alanine ligase MurF n=1 Tax=Rhodoferax sp. TaxID=50421 RepID=UPI00261197AF|nr:bifunctional UDP-N-acetylmuramoyl-L-alanyl-D-glutamate--2,6-diaminopimelate ligase MurE/UDP-N-acetylmuramoyl-tripeptide--D-alanyl-D-alanine ligase MurF [Rhodoferax sp.]MDD2882018.1 bifunctional UDP-N-acetylmuramoyl-L-alanyl-D-glutamate--2,6-diaminopimelate ligase MurE/UDP-N-acetylmuramoyl-tripeptide--D-alanyl-D-alanine ligase MurF [Rhodoferax sp.]
MLAQHHTPVQAVAWLRTLVTGRLCTDSRQIQPGDGFLAWPGAATDARTHVAAALAAGASACLVEHSGVDTFGLSDARIATYLNLKAASGLVASVWFGEPSARLAVLAVTGTNGKTSSTWWLAQALSNLKQATPMPCGVVGTLGVGVPPNLVTTGLTTPDPVALQAAFADFATHGLTACAIEASSIGIEEHRLAGTHIHTAVLTNVTQDHLDYHGDMAAYAAAKAKLFTWPGLRGAVINVDGPYGLALATELQHASSTLDVWTVSMAAGQANPARLQARDICYEAQGVAFTVVEGTQRMSLATQLIGAYNIANVLGVIAAMRTLAVPLDAAVAACQDLTPVPGRMECVSAMGKPLVAVDYAHTPDALAKALDALRPLVQARGGQLWCVFGCGGDRDTTKRPLMGAVAGAHADRVVVTSDNPRSEAPDAIISQILLGLAGAAGVQVEPDRARAIAQTLAQAATDDVVLLAGKGHEDYQEICGKRLPFSDLAQVKQVLAQWSLEAPSSVALQVTQSAKDAGFGDAELPHAATHGQMSLLQAAQWLALPVTGMDTADSANTTFARVHTDTRSIEPGDLFVALRGERFDANDFLAEARQKGAVAAICQGDNAAAKLAQANLPGLVVPDAKLALAQLATHWRAQFTLPVIAVTGSNGKTTVTQMIGSILRAWQGNASLATQGNLNNDIGVPLTVLRLRPEHRVAVVELGMNHPGEIAGLAAIAQPTVALVNNAQREHLEFMATVEAVAQENGAVIDALSADGVAVFPADDVYSGLWADLAGARASLCFSAGVPAGVYATKAVWSGAAWQVSAMTPAGMLQFGLHIAGAHNVKNSLAAVACALAAGVPLPAIAVGLEAFEPVKGRSRALLVKVNGRAITLVDDTYNANPDSVRAAIEVLAALPAPRLLVLGDMGEVGNHGPEFHAEALQFAIEKNIEKVLVTGAASAQAAMKFKKIESYASMADLQTEVLAALPHMASVLVKGSRFMKMEQVVQQICAAADVSDKGAPAC